MCFKKVKKVVLEISYVLSICAATATSASFLFNSCQHNNTKYYTRDWLIMNKMDGVFTYTALEINTENHKLRLRKDNTFCFLLADTYKDSNSDGLVDIIETTNTKNPFRYDFHFRTYYRDEDFKKYPELFMGADELLNKETRRFEELKIRTLGGG